MPSLPHHLPHPHTHQSPNSSPHRIHHQIRHLEKAHLQNQLEALNAEGQPEASQGRKPESPVGAEPLGRCQELGEEEPKRHKDGHIAEALDRPLSTLLEYAGEVQRQVMPGSVLHKPQKPNPDRRIQQEQAHENRQPQSNRAIHRALLPDQQDDCPCQRHHRHHRPVFPGDMAEKAAGVFL